LLLRLLLLPAVVVVVVVRNREVVDFDTDCGQQDSGDTAAAVAAAVNSIRCRLFRYCYQISESQPLSLDE
jgi:hypothetical protein